MDRPEAEDDARAFTLSLQNQGCGPQQRIDRIRQAGLDGKIVDVEDSLPGSSLTRYVFADGSRIAWSGVLKQVFWLSGATSE